MRVSVFFFAISGILLPLDSVQGQAPDPDWDLSLRASLSQFYLDFDRQPDNNWVQSFGGQARVSFLQFFHIEASVIRVRERGGVFCLYSEWPCKSYFVSPTYLVTGGGGIQAMFGPWMPFAGVGGRPDFEPGHQPSGLVLVFRFGVLPN